MHDCFSVNIIRPMKSALSKWVLYLLASLVVGPCLAWLTGMLSDVRGGEAATLLMNNSRLSITLLCFAAATVGSCALAWAGATALDTATGCFLGGICLAWGAWPLATMESLARLYGESTPLFRLALENALCMCIGLVAASLVSKSSPAITTPPAKKSGFASRIPSILIGAAVAAAACMFVANTSMKGQTFAGAIAGGIAAAVAIQFLSAKEGLQVSPLVPMVSIALVAIAGPIAVLLIQGGKFESAAMAGKVLAFAKPLSLEWPAGGLIGTALGLSWASGAIERHT